MLAAQTRLAQEVRRRPELYEIYLVELLALFADKGVAIQNVAISNHYMKVHQSFFDSLVISLKVLMITDG